MSTDYTIGELANAADVATSTIRYYERRGLVQPDDRSQCNYRLYGEKALERVRFIRAAQATGFTLDDVSELLSLKLAAKAPCDDVQTLMEQRLADVRSRMDDLKHVERVLKSFLRKCQASHRRGHCAVIEELSDTSTGATRQGRSGRVSEVADALRKSDFPKRFAADKSRLKIEVLRLVAKGRPVPLQQVETIGSRFGFAPRAARSFIKKMSERDGNGNVVGILGLSQAEHPHRFEVGRRVLSTWCAWDALFLPLLLKRAATVESECPATKETIRIKITPKKVTRVEPPASVVSIAVPKRTSKRLDTVAEIWKAFCQHVHFFSSEQAASQRIGAKRADIRLLTVEEGWELGRRTFAELLAHL